MKEKLPLWVRIVFGFFLAILLTSFVNVGIALFYEEPKYEDFCPNPERYIDNHDECIISGGEWQVYAGPKPVEGPEGYCDTNKECREEYEQVMEGYQRNVGYVPTLCGDDKNE